MDCTSWLSRCVMNQLHDTQTAAACCMSMALVDLIQEILTLFVVVKLLYKALV